MRGELCLHEHPRECGRIWLEPSTCRSPFSLTWLCLYRAVRARSGADPVRAAMLGISGAAVRQREPVGTA